MPTKSIEFQQNIADDVLAVCAAGHFASFTEAVNSIVGEVFAKDYKITINGVERNIRSLMTTNPYMKKDFDRFRVQGNFEKKFVTNFNCIPSDLLKRATYNFMKACCDFIRRKHSGLVQVGSLENIAIYYSDASLDHRWVAVYIDVKNATSSKISISRFLQLKLKTRYVDNNTNLLWNEIKNFLATSIHGTQDVYNLDYETLDSLTSHLNQA